MNRFGALLKHYLLISLCLAFIIGIIIHHTYPLLPLSPILFCVLLIPPILLFGYWKSHTIYIPALLLLASLSGFLHTANSTRQPLHEANIFSRITQEEDTVLIGTLHGMPLFDGKKSTVIIKSHFLRLEHEEDLSSVHGLVLLRLKDMWPSSILPGDKLVIRTRLSRPYQFSNPGGFDYPAFLDAKNIRIIGRINSPSHIQPLEQTNSRLHDLVYLPEKLRVSIKQKINESLPPQQAAMYRALLIGDRSSLNREQLESFKASGVFHILAISGLHLSIVASILFGTLYWLAKRSKFLMLRISCKKLALLATIPPLCSYALLAGFQTPVLRSLIMVIIFILSFCVQRQRSPFTTLSFAALIILLINPKTLFTVSFQLSFAAVASLILILPKLSIVIQRDRNQGSGKIQSLLMTIMHWTSAALFVSVAATLGTAPMLINSFNRFSTVGPVANLLIEPLLCLWSLPFGLLALPILFISPSLGELLLHTGSIGITAAAIITSFLAEQTFSTIWFPTPASGLILLYYVTLVFCFFHFSRRISVALFIAICTLFYFPPQSFLEKYGTESELVFLDVGQGSSTLVSFPHGKKVLIDGGGSSSEKFNVGESVIAPYLWKRSITKLDAIVITHPDSDHFNGIPFILKRFRPATLWINGDDGHEQEYDDLLNLAEKLGIDIRTPNKNQLLLQSGGAFLENISNPVLGKKESYKSRSRISSNDEGLILKFTSTNQELSCLFPGDISRRVEKELVRTIDNKTLQSSVLLSPHHGSKTSNSQLFIKNVRPEQIVVSAGSFRPLHFPSPQLRTTCKEESIQLLNTAELGAITIKTDGQKIITHHFNQDSKQL